MNLFALQKIKQKKNKHTYKLQNKSFKRYSFKIFLFNRKIKQFIVKLFFYYKIYYYFCSPF